MSNSRRDQHQTGDVPPPCGTALAVALLLRLAVLLIAWACGTAPAFFHEPDTKAYLLTSQNLFASGSFERAGEPEVFRTPGYPLFLVPAVAIDRIEVIAIGLQIALSVGTVLVVHRLAWLLYEQPDIARAAAWLAAWEPIALLYASKLLTETLFTFLFTSGLYFVVRYARTDRLQDLLAAALLFVAGAYTRPVGYYCVPLVALLLLVRLFSCRDGRAKRALHLLAFSLLAVVVLVPWQIRNYRLTGYAGFSSWSANALTYYSQIVRHSQPGDSLVTAMSRARFLDDVEYREAHPEQASWTPAERYQAQQEQAWPLFRADPGVTARIYWQGIVATLTDNGMTIVQGLTGSLLPHDDDTAAKAHLGTFGRVLRAIQRRPAFVLVYAMLQAILLSYIGLAALGLARQRSMGRWELILLLAAVLYLLLVSGGPFGSHRMRVPIMPLVSTFAAAGLCHVKEVVERRRARRQ